MWRGAETLLESSLLGEFVARRVCCRKTSLTYLPEDLTAALSVEHDLAEAVYSNMEKA